MTKTTFLEFTKVLGYLTTTTLAIDPLSFSPTATNSRTDEKNFMAPFYGVQLPQG